jgi:Domain of unknown function (DUF4287)/Domain of unknown function (DUF5655)
MSFQAYLDNIQKKTGKTADDFKAMAAKKGLVKTAEIMAWLKSDFELGHGHAMAIVHLIVHEEDNKANSDEKIGKLFAGNKTKWRKSYDEIVKKITGFGPDVTTSPGQTYVNLLRNGKKFAIVQPSSAERLDIGIKLKGLTPKGRFEEAGAWNAMVTHRVRISDPDQVDNDLFAWLKKAYDAL